MNPISLCLNLFLALLLLATLLLGRRLNRQLKALKDSHAGFASAVADLDRAASRAEKGLADLRATTDESIDLLHGRIEKGRELAAKLEQLTTAAAEAIDRAPPPAAPVQQAPASRIAALARVWARPANEETAPPPDDAEAAAESLVLKLSEVLDSREGPQRPRLRSLSSLRTRTPIDDDLFEASDRTATRAFAGGR